MDTEIVRNIISGDKKAFEMLFNDYYEKLGNFAYHYLKDKDNAEDVVQELFSKLWINREKLNVETSINSYLHGAVRNACLNLIKHQKVKSVYITESVTNTDYDDFIPNKIDAVDLSNLIRSSILDLPTERQKVFLLSREQGLKYQEIANKLGISVKTVEAQMGKALRFLRERLKEYLVILFMILIQIRNFI